MVVGSCAAPVGVVVCPYVDMEVADVPEQDKRAVFRAEFIRLCALAGYNRQDDLADVVGVAASTIRSIGRGANTPSLDLFLDLLDILGPDFIDLMRTSPALGVLRARHKVKKSDKPSSN